MVSVILVSYNTRELLDQCLEKVLASEAILSLEIFVVDNNSSDGSAKMVREKYPQVQLIANATNRGFAAANNQAWAKATGRYLLLLNPDAFVSPEAVSRAVAFMETHPDCGILGGRLIKPDGSLDPSARRFPSWLSKLFTISGLRSRYPRSPIFSRHEFGDFAHDRAIEVDWVPGTFTVYRRELLEQLGLFDERFYIYYEETDVCWTAKKNGWKVFFIPDAEVMHIGGASSKTRRDQAFDEGASQLVKFRMRSEWLYFRKNHGLAAVLANAGVELLWHGLRYLVNLIPGRRHGARKRAQARSLLRELTDSLAATAFGAVSPPAPW